MEGVLLINKPRGPSSFQVVKKIRALSKIKKVGHAGTLDPLAEGLLILCLGRYTKLASFLMDGDKVYETTFRLGEVSTTDDGEGEIAHRSTVNHITHEDIDKNLQRFIGIIEQLPPRYSAIKIGGRRAYNLARSGEELKLTPRSIEIFSITLINVDLPEITLCIHCSKGTYVRALARDLGEALGVGAYAKSICRVASGAFSIDDAISFTEITTEVISKHLRLGVNAVPHLETIAIDEVVCRRIKASGKLTKNILLKKEFAFLMHEGSLVAIIRKGLHGSEVARVF